MGAEGTGTFIELATGAQAAANRSELHKLSRQEGSQRVLLLLNPSATPVDMDSLKKRFKQIKPTRGRLPTRNDVRIVVCGEVKSARPTGTIADYSFVWQGVGAA